MGIPGRLDWKKLVGAVLLSFCMAISALLVAPGFDANMQAQAKRVVTQTTEYDYLSSDIKNNCVAFARYKVPSLPSGLNTQTDKANIINSYTPAVGSVAIYSYNHVSYVEKVNGSQITTLDGGFTETKNGSTYFTGHIARITGTASELSIIGYWNPGGSATPKKWYEGETVQNLGSDFYANILLNSTWVNATVSPSESYRIMNADPTKAGDTVNYRGIFWHFVRNSDGSYRILNIYHGARPLEAAGTTSGSQLQLGSSYTGSSKQKWFIYRANGKRIIRSAASDFVINVDSAKSTPGARWQLWTYTDSAAERLNIYTHTPAQATTLAVKAGTASDATTFTWSKPSTGETAYYNLRISALDANGNATSTKYDLEKIDAATTSETKQLPEGKYRASIETCSWFNTASSAAVTFEVKNTDTEKPTISEAKVTSVSDSAVTIVVKAHDNVGIAETAKTGEYATVDGVKYRDYVEIGVPGSGTRVLGAPIQTTTQSGLDSTPKKDATVTLKITSGLVCGHHFGQIVVTDVNGNASEPMYVEFDKAFKESMVVNMAVGEDMAAEDAFGISGAGWRCYEGEQGVVEITRSGSTPVEVTAKSAGTCTVLRENYNTGNYEMRKIVVTEAGQQAPTVDDADKAAADAALAAVWALPEAEDVTLDDASAIEAADAKLEGLTPAQLDLIPASTYRQLANKLKAAKDALAACREAAEEEAARESAAKTAKEAAQAAIAAAKALPAADDVTLDDAEAVYDARDGLYALDDGQMAYVSTSDWVSANAWVEAAMEKLQELMAAQSGSGDDPGPADDPKPADDPTPADEPTAKVDIATKAADMKLEYTSTAYWYGKALKPKVTVKGLKQGTDFTVSYANNVDAGKATATVEGMGKYTGKVALGFTITKADIGKAFSDMELKTTSYAYDGKAKKPAVVAYTHELKAACRTISYKANTAIGTATATVSGKGNYTGTKKLAFTIKPGKAAISKAAPGKKKVAVTAKALKGGVKYQVSYRISGGKWVNKTSSKATYTVSKLKSGKKYQVRVRAFKKVGSKTYYGAWSATKTVKVK